MAESYLEVRHDETGWCWLRRAGNHRPTWATGRASKPYERPGHAARAASHEHPDLEVRVFNREGELDRVVQPYY